MQQQQSLQNELHELFFALGDVVEAERAWLLLPLDLVLDESGPELIGQGSNSWLCAPSRLLREHANPREIVLQVLVLLCTYLCKALEDVLLRFLVVAIDRLEDTIHNVVALVLDPEVLARERD